MACCSSLQHFWCFRFVLFARPLPLRKLELPELEGPQLGHAPAYWKLGVLTPKPVSILTPTPNPTAMLSISVTRGCIRRQILLEGGVHIAGSTARKIVLWGTTLNPPSPPPHLSPTRVRTSVVSRMPPLAHNSRWRHRRAQPRARTATSSPPPATSSLCKSASTTASEPCGTTTTSGSTCRGGRTGGSCRAAPLDSALIWTVHRPGLPSSL